MVTNGDRLELCGICRKPSSRLRGMVYYGGGDWYVSRLFVCDACQANLLTQRTLHEMCYECVESFPKGYVGNGLIGKLWTVRDQFEKAHARIFDRLPATTEEEPHYPGSLNQDLGEWLEKNYPDRDESKESR